MGVYRAEEQLDVARLRDARPAAHSRQARPTSSPMESRRPRAASATWHASKKEIVSWTERRSRRATDGLLASGRRERVVVYDHTRREVPV
jgi:hypothetical protein